MDKELILLNTDKTFFELDFTLIEYQGEQLYSLREAPDRSGLYPPFPPLSINQNQIDAIYRDGTNWLKKFDILEKGRRPEATIGGVPEFASLVCSGPVASDLLALFTEVFIWLTVCEDGLYTHSSGVVEFLTRLPELLMVFDHPDQPSYSSDGIVLALIDLRDQIQAKASRQMLIRFGEAIREYLLAIVWETMLRKGDSFPTVQGFRSLRRRSGGIFPCIWATCIARGVDPDDNDLTRDDISALTNLTADYSVIMNDLFSGAREMAYEKGSIQYQRIFMRERKISIEEAVKLTLHECNKIMRQFIEYTERCERQASSELLRYIDALDGWVRIAIAWCKSCPRYHSWTEEHLEQSI
jgi:hypothetical protein